MSFPVLVVNLDRSVPAVPFVDPTLGILPTGSQPTSALHRSLRLCRHRVGECRQSPWWRNKPMSTLSVMAHADKPLASASILRTLDACHSRPRAVGMPLRLSSSAIARRLRPSSRNCTTSPRNACLLSRALSLAACTASGRATAILGFPSRFPRDLAIRRDARIRSDTLRRCSAAAAAMEAIVARFASGMSSATNSTFSSRSRSTKAALRWMGRNLGITSVASWRLALLIAASNCARRR
jgi:hypothetical protein